MEVEHDNGSTQGAERYDIDSSMGLPHLTSFLWCLTLKVGARLVSIMHCVLSVSAVVACALLASDARGYVGGADDADGVYSRAYHAALAVAAVSAAHVGLACLLVFGVFWRKPTLIRLWVMVMSALLLASVVLVLLSALVLGFNASGSDIFVDFVQAIAAFGFIAYCILCVYSYYLFLKSTEQMDRPNKVDY